MQLIQRIKEENNFMTAQHQGGTSLLSVRKINYTWHFCSKRNCTFLQLASADNHQAQGHNRFQFHKEEKQCSTVKLEHLAFLIIIT